MNMIRFLRLVFIAIVFVGLAGVTAFAIFPVPFIYAYMNVFSEPVTMEGAKAIYDQRAKDSQTKSNELPN
jgi:hypothetical protein